MVFYDDDWRRLVAKHPLIARKLEELRCEAVLYEQFRDEVEALQNLVKDLHQELEQLRTHVARIRYQMAIPAR